MDVTATRLAASALDVFHPAVAAWFRRTFAAPTGSGKTLTAFLCALDDLVRDALAHDGTLPDATLVV